MCRAVRFFTPDVLRVVLLGVVSVLLAACQTLRPPGPAMTPAEMERSLPEDVRSVDNIERSNAGLRQSFLALRDSGGWGKRGYFSPLESDRLEFLLFRFHTQHQLLLGIADRYAGASGETATARRAKELHSRANTLARKQAQFLVDCFEGDPVAIAMCNQAHPRSGIPRRTYDRLVEILAIPIAREAARLSRKVADDLNESSYQFQAELFYRVSRLRSPFARQIPFSEERKGEIVSLLEPGDLILTYSGGYASDVFIPGTFKHGMTWIGSVEDRRAAGISADRVSQAGDFLGKPKMAAKLRQASTDQGRPANVIEAVAEGVKFSNLQHLLDTHISRLVVLRPNLSSRDRATQVVRAFSYLGQEYDFRFDFADSSRQVCTEVIYRSLNGLSDIDFPLTMRGTHLTLSADDLLSYWLDRHPEAFSFVLYGESGRGRGRRTGRVLTGADGKHRLEEVLAEGMMNYFKTER